MVAKYAVPLAVERLREKEDEEGGCEAVAEEGAGGAEGEGEDVCEVEEGDLEEYY